MAEDKSVVSTKNLVFLGLETNNVAMIVKVPVQRRLKLLPLSQKLTDRKLITLKQLESFLNKLVLLSRLLQQKGHLREYCIMLPFAWSTKKFLQIKARKNDNKQLLFIFKGAVFFSVRQHGHLT